MKKLISSICLFVVLTAKVQATAEIMGFSSGRSPEEFNQLMKDAEVISDIAFKLGYPVPDIHKMTFVASDILARLTAMGRHALPVWHDGQQVMRSLSRPSGILEFVTDSSSNCSHCNRSYYTDIESIRTQRQVIEHVAGHNFFSAANFKIASIINDTMGASLELAEVMRELSGLLPEGEVSKYIQKLYSFEHLVDACHGSYDPPEKFMRGAVSAYNIAFGLHNPKETSKIRAKAPNSQLPSFSSFSVLSALVANVPQDEPWKVDLITRFESINRHYPGNYQTKIVNEGWATFSQLLIHKHSPWQLDDEANFEAGDLLSGVAYKRLGNPYWLGLEGWRHLYKKFNRRMQDRTDLTAMEKDRLFVSEAKEITHSANSYNFILKALDDEWVRDNKLGMYREATEEEIEKFCEGKDASCRPGQNEKAMVLLTWNAQRIIRNIAREQADLSLALPMIAFISENWKNTGAIMLKQEKRPAQDFSVPVDLASAAQVLYIMANVMQKPIMLESFMIEVPKPKDPHYEDRKRFALMFNTPFNEPEPEQTGVKKLTYHDFTIKVDATGECSIVEGVTDHMRPVIEAVMSKAIAAYKEDESYTENDEFEDSAAFRKAQSFTSTHLENTMGKAHLTVNSHHRGLVSHAPTSSEAILAYLRMSEKRLAKMLTLAVQGKIASNKGKSQVAFRHLPLIPQFRLDSQDMNHILQAMPPAPIDDPNSLPRVPYHWGQDDNTKTTFFPDKFLKLKPGDIFKVPKPQPGQGQGEGESEDGEPEEDGEPKAGKGGNGPSDVSVSIQDWGKVLAEEISLPNIRNTIQGDSKITVRKPAGTVRKEDGDLIYPKMVKSALSHALLEKMRDKIAEDEENSEDEEESKGLFDDFEPITAIQRGFELIQPNDNIVVGRKEFPRPLMQAVVCIVMDFSGSMMGEPHQAAANFVFNLRALLLAKYDTVKFHFVVYDSEAHEFTEDQVFGKNPKFLGGGTSNVSGYKKAKEVLANYDYAAWNKYVIGLGDAGASDGLETAQLMREIYPDTQYMAWIHTANGGWADQGFLMTMQALAKELPWFGYTELPDSSQGNTIKALKTLFHNEAGN